MEIKDPSFEYSWQKKVDSGNPPADYVELFVEDGSGSNPEANTYSDLDSFKLFAEYIGIDVSNLSDNKCRILLIKAMDYIEAQKDKFKGYKTDNNQPLEWPRSDVRGVSFSEALLPKNLIPRQLIYGQLNLACEILSPKDSTITLDNQRLHWPSELKDSDDLNLVPANAGSHALLSQLYK